METVHFGLGENMGQVLTDIAREKLLYEFNPKAAIETLINALMGLPIALAQDILIGKKVLKVVGDEMEIVPYIPSDDTNQNFYLFERIEPQYNDMLNDCDEYLKGLRRFYMKHWNGLKNSDLTVTVSVSQFLAVALDDEEMTLEDMPEYQFMRAVKLFIDKSTKFVVMVKWCYDTYGSDYIGENLAVFPRRLTSLIEAVNCLRHGIAPEDWESDINKMNLMQANLNQFITALDENDHKLAVENGLKPTGPEEYFDGGWLSPDGKFFGLNGTFANFIHVAIADNLKEHKWIPQEDAPELWMENNGWIKLHFDQVHFTPMVPGNKFPIFVTEAQQSFLKEWAKNHFKGVLKFGWKFEEVPYTKFGSMDAHMMTLLFR